VRDLLGDGTTFKRRVKEGEGEFPADCPMHDCDIKCHYVARTIPDRTVVYGAALLALPSFHASAHTLVPPRRGGDTLAVVSAERLPCSLQTDRSHDSRTDVAVRPLPCPPQTAPQPCSYGACAHRHAA
jgi:hypothetical protein